MRTALTTAIITALLALAMPGISADEVDEGEAPQLNDRSTMKISLLADFVAGVDADDTAVADATATVTDMRTSGIGWGALFKIYRLAAAMGTDPAALVGEIGADGEFDFGELKNSLTAEQRAAYDELPKNFGTLKAAEKKAEMAQAKIDRKAAKDARKAERDAGKSASGQDGGDEVENDPEDDGQ